MKPYSDEESEDWKLDWYEVGGRWSGFTGVKKGKECYPSKNDAFAYEFFDTYDAIVNGGNRGPYIIDGVEYIPVTGDRKKDIEWDSIEKFDRARALGLFQVVLDEERRERMLNGRIPAGVHIEGDCLCANETSMILYKKGETFEENASRLGVEFGRSILLLDAYVDKKGVWHDDGEIWEDHELIGKLMKESENVEGAAMDVLMGRFYEYLDTEASEDDYIVVVDAHN